MRNDVKNLLKNIGFKDDTNIPNVKYIYKKYILYYSSGYFLFDNAIMIAHCVNDDELIKCLNVIVRKNKIKSLLCV